MEENDLILSHVCSEQTGNVEAEHNWLLFLANEGSRVKSRYSGILGGSMVGMIMKTSKSLTPLLVEKLQH